MKSFSKLVTVFSLYLLTVPTNVMCLGAFTEVWLKDFCISRSQLSCLYLSSTLIVFVVMVFEKRMRSTIKVLGGLSLALGALIMLPKYSAILWFFFFLSQWLGQGCLVAQCRCQLFNVAHPLRYGYMVGFLEAMGTCAVFLCPFLLLSIIQRWNWQITLGGLALIYGCVAFFFKLPMQKEVAALGAVYKDIKFWLVNFIIYLPVIFVSGLFFHLEGFCKVYQVPVSFWERASLIQVSGIIVGQIFFGYLWRNRFKVVSAFITLLGVSQAVWLLNWKYFNLEISVVCSIIGWSLFGVLVNGFWGFLYRNQPWLIEEGIQGSVSFGFLANAIGPVVMCAFF